MSRSSEAGYTMVEVMIAILVSVTLMGSMVMTFLTVKSINMMARHKIQATQLVRGQMENLKATPFANLADATMTASYDAGADGIYGTADDMQGTLTTLVADAMDFDNDGITAETQINVDGSGGNDTTARPIRVTFAWNERVIGQTRNMSVSADTIIAQ